MGALVFCAAAAVVGQDATLATLVFYDGFGDGLGGWTATNFELADPRFRPDPTAQGVLTGSQGCELTRSFDGLDGWVLWRYDYSGIGPYVSVGYSHGSVGLRFREGDGDTLETFAIAGNFYYMSWLRLHMACTVHRTGSAGRSQGGFYANPDSTGTELLLDNIAVYQLDPAARLDSAEWMRNVAVGRAAPSGDPLYAVTYSGIPMRGHTTLLVHLAPQGLSRKPLGFYVNDSAVGGVNEPFTSYDEISFGWVPHTDSVSVTFWGIEDSIAFSSSELTIFTLDLDTAADPRAAGARAPQGAAVRIEPFARGSIAVFDVKGRRVESRDTRLGRTPGVYLRFESPERRARPVVGVGAR